LLRLEVGPVAHGGHCVARYQGRVVFVRHALPGETVLARLTVGGRRAKYWRADAVEVLTASPDRVRPPCPLAGPSKCGGCDWQHASLAAQRELKAAVVTEQLRRLARLDPGGSGPNAVPPVVVEAVPGALGKPGHSGEPVHSGESGEPDGQGLGWRTRIRFSVDAAGRVGLHRHRSHELIEVEECLIADPRLTELGLGRQHWRDTAAVEAIVPSGESERLVVVEPVNAGSGGAARLKLPRLPVPASVATRDDEGLHQVRGRTWVSEQVLVAGRPRQFRVTGTGFWQVHPGAAQTLLDAVLAAADARPGERALDLYGGVGLFGAGLAAQVGPTGSVLVVESDQRASADSRRSLHDLTWVRFENDSVERALAGPAIGGADVVVLDPPRAGAGRAVMDQIAALAPRVIVYVACDPAALARDLATASGLGYRLARLRAFDLFPMTHHVECVATLVPNS
jgi:tRNA/tmRNA/rRNA uracil-C5-methylase (TrmA/RlmC/RlmD family)